MMKEAARRNGISLILAFSCFLMCLLIFQQARTIDSQRTLIKQLFQDSLELNAMKVQKIQSRLKH